MSDTFESGAGGNADPQYPDVLIRPSSSNLHMTREKSFTAWVGRREQLLRIEKLIADALKDVYDRELARLKLPQGSMERRLAIKDLQRRLVLDVRVVAANGQLTRTGSMASILDEMSPSEIESVAMGNLSVYSDGGSERIALALGGRAHYDDPVHVSVAGGSSHWVAGIFDVLVGEVRKSVPWWAWLRRSFASIALGAFLAAGTVGVLLTTTSITPQNRGTVFSNAFIVFLSLLLGFTIVIRQLLNKAFPALEILDAGGTPRGRRVLGALVAVLSFGMGVAGVVLGIISL